jgi:hypothetical protein
VPSLWRELYQKHVFPNLHKLPNIDDLEWRQALIDWQHVKKASDEALALMRKHDITLLHVRNEFCKELPSTLGVCVLPLAVGHMHSPHFCFRVCSLFFPY